MAESRAEQIRELDKLLSQQENRIKLAFNQYVINSLQDETIAQIVDALAANDVDRALEILRPHVLALSSVLSIVYIDVGVRMAAEIGRVLSAPTIAILPAQAAPDIAQPIPATVPTIPTPVVGVGFDPSHTRAVEQMQQAKINLVEQITGQQREVIRTVMQQSFEQGMGPRQTAALLKESIGLTSHQQQAVQRYRELLEQRNSKALRRQLRDRRFDRTIERSIKLDKPLSQEQIDKMVQRYKERYIQYRAETIARTEGVKATNKARLEAIQQTIDETGIDPSDIRLKWNVTKDHRLRDWHRTMDGQTIHMGETFTDGLGNKLRHPGDDAAPAETTVNCRCILTISQTS